MDSNIVVHLTIVLIKYSCTWCCLLYIFLLTSRPQVTAALARHGLLTGSCSSSPPKSAVSESSTSSSNSEAGPVEVSA